MDNKLAILPMHMCKYMCIPFVPRVLHFSGLIIS